MNPPNHIPAIIVGIWGCPAYLYEVRYLKNLGTDI
jgi:hypothetical protein